MAEIIKEKFDWNLFKGNGNIAVNCQTEEEANQFMKLMHEHEMTWSTGDSYLDINAGFYYTNYKERTCFHGNGKYGGLDYANKSKCIILKFSMLDFD